jgi:hypothetical protein
MRGTAERDRLARHAALAERLSRADDDDLLDLLAGGRDARAGVVGDSRVLLVEGVRVFAKRIPLTDLERRPGNERSTRNLFDVPLECHYGLGGPGFSAWRELAASLLATRFVVAGERECFPLTHHWRVLPAAGGERAPVDGGAWTASPAVLARAQAVRRASADLVLFLEHVPWNLLEWLRGRLSAGDGPAAAALAFVDAHLEPDLAWMSARGFAHFDAHFENVLTDGRRLHFGDLGLALCREFDLDEGERRFLERHRRYDLGRASTAYVHAIASSLLGDEGWEARVRAHLEGGGPRLPEAAGRVLRREAPRALAYLEFTRRLRRDPREPYPADL